MPSQFFGLTIAGSGLRASNAALNTTANNISNAQTQGYSRQQVSQQASNALRTFTTYGCAGAGVDTIAIERVRDSFYDEKYWSNNSKFGNYSMKQYYMRTIEDYFKDDGKSGFKTVFDKMSAALQSVTTNSSSTSSKAQFIAAAKSLTDYFNNMYGNLQELQKDINLEIKQNVDQINSIAEKIATLNKQINVIELSGSKANDLRDQRELLIDELSEIVDVKTIEHKITDTNDPTRETGGTRYIVQIAGGQTLVDASDYNSLSYVARKSDEKINQTDVDGLYNIQWENGNEFSLANASLDGKLKGLYELCYGNDKANFNGKVTAVDAANDTITVKVTDDKLKNMTECMLSDSGGEITIGNTVYLYDSWSYQEPDEYTFVLKNDAKRSPKIDAGKVGKEVKTADEVAYQGIPYYMQQMNTWIRGFADKVNEIFHAGTNTYDQTGDANAGNILFTGTDHNGKQYSRDDLLNPKNTAGGTTFGRYYNLTAGNFTINATLLNEMGGDPDLLGTRTSEKVGVEECGQIKEVIELLTSKEKYSFRNSSANQMLELVLSDVALNASNANTFYDTYNGLRTAIDNQRTSVSGVDEDEEAVSLVKYQNSFTLASKMVQTLTEIYDQLILNTGV